MSQFAGVISAQAYEDEQKTYSIDQVSNSENLSSEIFNILNNLDINQLALNVDSVNFTRMFFSFIIEPNGTTSDFHVIRSIHPKVDELVRKYISTAQFSPGLINEIPVRLQVTAPLTLNFN